MTTTTTTLRLKVKTLDDFQSRGLIGKWFGKLRLLDVTHSPQGEKTLKQAACRVVCARGHEYHMPWYRLRDPDRWNACAVCKPPQQRKPSRTRPVTNLSSERLINAIRQLAPTRRRLLAALLDSRQQAPGQDDTTPRDNLMDAFAYARDVKDPEGELRDMLAPEGEYETYGRSASLCSPRLIYVATE